MSKHTMQVSAATKVVNPVVYCKAITKDEEPTPLQIIEWRMKGVEEDLRQMIKDARFWGDNLMKDKRFQFLKEEYQFHRAMLEEAKREWEPPAPTIQDLAAKFNCK